MSVLLFISGLAIAAIGLRSDHQSQLQADKLTQQANISYAATTSPPKTTKKQPPPTTTKKQPPPTTALATVKPTYQSLASYTVPANNPRYIKIPSLGVNARILNVSTDKNGALKTPNNVFDTAWYNQSNLPGEPGAMLIDGHVSSWTSHGVFYGIKKLVGGDSISITRGDGKVFNYSVVSTKIYDVNNVDMKAAVTPIDSTVPGLNLITCGGKVKPGTSEFNERVIVFAKQIGS